MQAFPSQHNPKTGRMEEGMTLRDYMAGKALQGLLSTVKNEEWKADEVASIAYQVADEMLKARA